VSVYLERVRTQEPFPWICTRRNSCPSSSADHVVSAVSACGFGPRVPRGIREYLGEGGMIVRQGGEVEHVPRKCIIAINS